MTAAQVAGIDVGGTGIKAVLADRTGQLLGGATRIATPRPGPDIARRTADAVASLLDTLRASATGPLRAVGVVVPGLVDEARAVGVFSENLGWRDAPFGELLAERLDLPVAFGHDVRAGGLAEARLGAGRGKGDSVFLPIGTGISAALHLDGRPYPAGGYAGEIGHTDVGHGEPCVCGAAGCLEAIASASAIARRYTRRSGRAVGGAAEVLALRAAGDADAAAVWAEAVSALVTGLAWLAGVLAPRTVIVGGGLAGAGTALLEPLARQLADRLTFQRVPELVPAALGDQAGCRGAALLAWDTTC
ncbi:ROK family protein [Streptacidiphilus sp. PB12-B1b]|uniref:ROK family protein n=1 Tax=Streptacidiphilus sp. PB12-B1b TaxID=2705012 RepID=UPI0015F9441B|nr:ROK family protein [Streptacidiphilus sp. PB12-B1b]QMU77761.1 ROK family protein [Streptacidiphilus sp. PB12-B1b]